jgi:hypothetical protein
MKADHRKELQTNLLADRMGRLVQEIKAGPRSSSAFAWVIAVLVVVVLAGWYWAGYQNARQSEEWVRLLNDPRSEGRDSAAYYGGVARQTPGSLAGRTARFQQARALLNRGLMTFFSPDVHGQAVQDLANAGELYRRLLGECQGNAVLEQEALLAAGKIEETLSGEPDRDNPDKKLGSLDRALAFYQRLTGSYPDSYEAKLAQKRIEELNDGATRSRMAEFYAKLAQYVKKPEPPVPPISGTQIPPPAPPTP